MLLTIPGFFCHTSNQKTINWLLPLPPASSHDCLINGEDVKQAGLHMQSISMLTLGWMSVKCCFQLKNECKASFLCGCFKLKITWIWPKTIGEEAVCLSSVALYMFIHLSDIIETVTEKPDTVSMFHVLSTQRFRHKYAGFFSWFLVKIRILLCFQSIQCLRKENGGKDI